MSANPNSINSAGDGASSKVEPKEMLTPLLRQSLSKQGKKLGAKLPWLINLQFAFFMVYHTEPILHPLLAEMVQKLTLKKHVKVIHVKQHPFIREMLVIGFPINRVLASYM